MITPHHIRSKEMMDIVLSELDRSQLWFAKMLSLQGVVSTYTRFAVAICSIIELSMLSTTS